MSVYDIIRLLKGVQNFEPLIQFINRIDTDKDATTFGARLQVYLSKYSDAIYRKKLQMVMPILLCARHVETAVNTGIDNLYYSPEHLLYDVVDFTSSEPDPVEHLQRLCSGKLSTPEMLNQADSFTHDFISLDDPSVNPILQSMHRDLNRFFSLHERSIICGLRGPDTDFRCEDTFVVSIMMGLVKLLEW